MAKIVVTGHDIGLGKIAYEELLADGHEVVGVCRPDWDLDSPDDREWLVTNYAHFDVLINNAYELDPKKLADPDRKIGQIELLDCFLREWEGNDSKYIISHSSKASLRHPQKDPYLKRYALDKKAHDKFIDKWLSTKPNGPNLCNLMIGWYAGSHEQIYIKQHAQLADAVSKIDAVNPTAYTDLIKLAIHNKELVWPNVIIVDKSDRMVSWETYNAGSEMARSRI